MKRLRAVILLFLMLPCLLACAQEEEILYPVSFHYLRAPQPNGEVYHGAADSVIAPEVREGDGYQNDPVYLLELYLLGPLNRDYRSPYPVGTFLEAFSMENGVVQITLSDDFGELSGIDLTLACGCLTLTVLDLTGAESVTIRAEDTLLDGKESITMDRGTMILTDDTTAETN